MSAEELLISMGPILLAFAFFVIFGLLSSREKRRRIELNHRERMAAIEKGVPLPEMPELDSPNPWNRPRLQKSYPDAALIWGIILLSAGTGGMGALALSSIRWPRWHFRSGRCGHFASLGLL